MLKQRVISGIVLVIIGLVTMLLGGKVLGMTLLIISEIGLFELYRVMKMDNTPMACCGYVCTAFYYLYLFLKDSKAAPGFFHEGILVIVIPLTLLCLFFFVINYPKYSAAQLFATVFGFLYVPVMLSYIFRTREEIRLGEWIVFMIFLASWVSDTCAYFVGRMLGKKKLAPVLSPKKTVEGSLGGIIGSAVLSAVYGLLMCINVGEPYFIIAIFAVIGAAGSAISQIGDLAASGIKRNYEIKDYGNLIPGHGGILDRFDSVIITAPIVFYLAYFLIDIGNKL